MKVAKIYSLLSGWYRDYNSSLLISRDFFVLSEQFLQDQLVKKGSISTTKADSKIRASAGFSISKTGKQEE